MTLWVNAIFGNPARVELDLFTLAQGDMGMGDMLVITDPSVVQMTYVKTYSGFVQDRLHEIINTVFPNQIIVTGVDSTYGFMNGPFWQSITSIGGGVTVVKAGANCSGGTPLYTNELIKVVYDTEGCNGSGYWVRDTHNNKIVEGPITILFHELAHAYHWAHRSSQWCTTGHAQVIADENLMRVQFTLPKRNPANDEGGCGPPSTYSNPWEDCFIVSAVSGSPRSVQVREFQRIRDSLLRPTRLGRALFATLFGEYYQFAPRVVADMEAAPELKEQIKRLVVEPLLDLLMLTELHVRLDLRGGALDQEVTQVFAQGWDRLGRQEISADTVARLAALMVRITSGLNGTAAQPETTPPQSAPSDPDATLRYLASTIHAGTPRTRALAWCLAQPLTIYWATLRLLVMDQEATQESAVSPGEQLAVAIEGWLAQAPLHWGPAAACADTVSADLQALAASVFTSRAVRHRIGARMLAHSPGPLRPRLTEDMRAADFLPHAG